MGEVRSINAIRADRENDNSLLSPIEALEDAAEDLRSGRRTCTKLLVVMLDSGKDGTAYNVGYYASQLRASESVALLETAKQKFLKQLAGED